MKARLGDKTIGPTSKTPAEAKGIKENDSMSFAASTTLITGVPPPPVTGCRGFDTNARNFNPLVVCVEVEDGVELPQESNAIDAANRTAIISEALFNLGLRRALRNNDLDARKADYNRAEWLASQREQAVLVRLRYPVSS